MKTVQDALKKQLMDHHKKLDLDLRDKEESIKKSVKKREQIGVELYAVQEQLARVQAMTESAEDNFGVIRNLREEAERAQKQYAEQYNLKQEKWRHQNKNCKSLNLIL
jgi:hypothetical protein